MSLPPPVIETIEGFRVVRDDLLPGGTKRRAMEMLITQGQEYIYASPACGYAQVALAYACRDRGAQAVVFTAARKTPHARTEEAKAVGAKVYTIYPGYLSTVQARAREYARRGGGNLIPFGCDYPSFVEALAAVAAAIPAPEEFWTVAGSGTLSRALQRAWPRAVAVAVRVGKPPQVGRAELYGVREKFEEPAAAPPPFPSCPEYDAKAWRLLLANARPAALFWNVGA